MTFYQKKLDTCGHDVYQACQVWLEHDILPPNFSDTNIVQENQQMMKNVTPIFLCAREMLEHNFCNIHSFT